MELPPNTQSLISLILPDMAAVLHVFLLGILAALFLSPLEYIAPAKRQNVFLRKGLLVDICFWFTTPLLTRIFTGAIIAVVFFGFAKIFQIPVSHSEGFARGFGPLARQPLFLQALEMLIIADFVDYWSHRVFHSSRLWPIHAIHHSPEEMSWLSSSRVHPLNDLVTRSVQVIPIFALGFSPHAILSVLPYISFYVMFLHSNVRWDFGPIFRWVLVSPAYHRWHHTSDAEGIDKNFAGIFPVWDLLFGTCYFPKHLPTLDGVDGDPIPETFLGQLAFPFVRLSR